MPSTKDATLELIQKEINEVVQREKELKELYNRSESLYETNDNDFIKKPPLERAKSVSALTNGNNRLFTQNVTARGVMQRFIKSRGRLSFTNNNIIKTAPEESTWSNLAAELTKPVVPTGTQPRNGFIPVEERIRREFQDMQEREIELRTERKKSQPDLFHLNSSPEPERRSLRATSVLQLNDYSTYNESVSAPASLKGAKSLSDLCDIDGEEELPPGSHSLIKQWESLIKQNQIHT
ncbi:hypothetical protein RN001_003287 [Aquatica leii]|uniref:A-kinase anchor protein 2 C-terminal domain-containing protein n=1 Tax=Aquatica leii TaxID=1421715 RepID=A0AAN7PQY4_9COLE|nr:hypothetical protein RN001_003287 [Aquatica leii]